jgi:hypothetical protein
VAETGTEAQRIADAIRTGDAVSLEQLLREHPELMSAGGSRTWLQPRSRTPSPSASGTPARRLLERGANPAWVGHDELTAAQAAERSGAHELAARLR